MLCDRVEQRLKDADYDSDYVVLDDKKVFYKNRNEMTVEWLCSSCESKLSVLFKPRDQYVDKRIEAVEKTLSANAVGLQNVYNKFLEFEERLKKSTGKTDRKQANLPEWIYGMQKAPDDGQQVLFNQSGEKTHYGHYTRGYFYVGGLAKHTLDCYWMPIPELRLK